MGKMFYSYDDGQLYMLHGECTLRTLMKEQATENGMLIHTCEGLFELVEYIGGRPVEFDARLINGDVVLHRVHQVEDKQNHADMVAKSLIEELLR